MAWTPHPSRQVGQTPALKCPPPRGHSKYTPGAGWQRAGGAGLGAPPFLPTDGDRVYNAFDYDMRSWVHDIAVGADGLPRITFATFSLASNYTDHRYWYARWDGQAWQKREIARAGPSIDPDGEVQYSAGIVLDPENPEIVYLARKKGNWFQIEAWRTPDGGATWRVTPLTTSAKHHMRPVAPRNFPGTQSTQVLFMFGGYNSYRTYETDIALELHKLA